MPDKRTFGLTTIDVAVALDNGYLVVDTAALAGIDAEQQNVFIKTLLDAYALSGADFDIGDLKVKIVLTTNNTISTMMLVDDAGNVVMRDIAALLEGTGAVKTNITNLTDPLTESYKQEGSNQKQINDQNASKLNNLQDQLDNLTTTGATGTIIILSPLDIPETETVLPFEVLFPSNNPAVFEFDALNNQINYNAAGIFDNNTFLQIDNQSGGDKDVTFKLRNKTTLVDIVDPVTIQIPGNDTFSLTWVYRYNITAPLIAEITMEADDDDLVIVNAQLSVTNISTTGVIIDFARKTQDETITGAWTFDNNLIVNNNLGIGITSPVEKLDVRGSTLIRGSGAGNFSALKLYRNSVSVGDNISIDAYNSTSLGLVTGRIIFERVSGGASNIDFQTFNFGDSALKSNLYIKNDGNIGIGTTTPSEKLEVNGNILVSNAIIKRNNTFEALLKASRTDLSSELTFGSNGGNAWNIPQRLAIGKQGNADEVLHVVGTAKITGNTRIGSNDAPTEALDVAGNVKATAFIGDGSQLTGVGSATSGIYWSGTIDATGNIVTQEGAGVGTVTTSYNGSTYYRVNHALATQNYRVFATAYAGGRTQGTMIALPSTKDDNYVDLYPVNASDASVTAILEVIIVKL